MIDKATKGTIFEIQRFSIHDGPGIRTTVFLKGCSLSCIWCHNPESLQAAPQLSYSPGKCIGCGFCFKECPNDCHQMEGDKRIFDRSACDACGKCTTECYVGALEIVGKTMTVEDVLDEVLRDRAFYETSSGGMTLSGGEPLVQIDFAEALLKAAKDVGLHTCIETCCHVSGDRIERVRPFIDLFLCDFKESDSDRHRQYAGAGNELIIENIRKLDSTGASILLRCPIIPGLNDRDDHFDGIANLAGSLKSLKGVELMPYHRLGEGKLDRMGMANVTRAKSHQPTKEEIASWAQALQDRGIAVINEL